MEMLWFGFQCFFNKHTFLSRYFWCMLSRFKYFVRNSKYGIILFNVYSVSGFESAWNVRLWSRFKMTYFFFFFLIQTPENKLHFPSFDVSCFSFSQILYKHIVLKQILNNNTTFNLWSGAIKKFWTLLILLNFLDKFNVKYRFFAETLYLFFIF